MVPPPPGFALSSELSCQPDNPWKVICILFFGIALVFCSCNLSCSGMNFFFFFLLRKTLGLLNLLDCSDQFQKILSHSLHISPHQFLFSSTSGPLVKHVGPPHCVPRFLTLSAFHVSAFPCHTLCNFSWPILQFANSLQLFIICFQISLLLKIFPSSIWFFQTCWVSFCGFSFLTDIPSLSCSWKHSESCFIQCGMLCLLVCCHHFCKSLAAFPCTPSYLWPYAGRRIWETVCRNNLKHRIKIPKIHSHLEPQNVPSLE